MIKRHFFLAAAAVLLGLMVVAVVWRLAFAGDEKAGGGPGGRGGPGGGRGQTVSEASVSEDDWDDYIIQEDH